MSRILSAALGTLLITLGIGLSACDLSDPNVNDQEGPPVDAGSTWWKGEIHSHSVWSDGDDYPEMIADWYKENGFNFLAVTDHNTVQAGEKWIGKRPTNVHQQYVDKMGADWVEERTVDGKEQVRLKTLEEYAPLFDEEGRFLLLQGEEISDKLSDKQVHMNVLNLAATIRPQRGYTKAQIIERTLAAIREQADTTGRDVYFQLNHPNFTQAFGPADLIGTTEITHFEVYNGHPHVDNTGDNASFSSERLWDIALTKRVEKGQPLLYGTAVSDAHDYHEFGQRKRNPGRGFVMVRAEELTTETLIDALNSGDFYASTGVEIDNIEVDGSKLTVSIEPESGVTYTTQFIGTRTGYTPVGSPTYSDEIGVVLSEVTGVTPEYEFTGDELYVRAKIISSKPEENPLHAGDMERAWTQPITPSVQ